MSPTRRSLLITSAAAAAFSLIPMHFAAAAVKDAIRPFRIDIPEEALLDLRRRILATRWPDRETVTDQSQGVQLAKLRELVRHWGTDYDWRKVEATLNALPQFVTEIDGVRFYNDSKATSVDATLKALEAFADEPGKVVLILGGRGKKAPYAPLESLVRTKVRKLMLIGEDADTIAAELGDFAPFERALDMKDAVRRSFSAAEKGDVVLLAPACASFDMFESFEQRGRVFKNEVSFLAKAQRRKEGI